MNRINFPAFLLCVALSTGAAFAGSKFTGNGHVWITKNADGSGSGSGYLGMIYNGPDNEWIGCQKSSTNLVMCHAKNTDQLIVDCWANSAFLANSVSSISADARLVFIFDAGGRCTQITVQHSSAFEDKQ
jgi:hypothetical protein